MIEELKFILLDEVRRRRLTTLDLVAMTGLSIRTIQRALAIDGTNTSVSLYVYEELFHALNITIERKNK